MFGIKYENVIDAIYGNYGWAMTEY